MELGDEAGISTGNLVYTIIIEHPIVQSEANTNLSIDGIAEGIDQEEADNGEIWTEEETVEP